MGAPKSRETFWGEEKPRNGEISAESRNDKWSALRRDGEVPQYYVEHSHPAIIAPEVFDMVQFEIEKRKGKTVCSGNIFSGKIICGDCGSFYGSKVWHSNDKYSKKICICNGKYKSGSPQNVSFEGEKEQLCSGKHFSDKENRIAKDAATRRCNDKYKHGTKCQTPTVSEAQIKEKFVEAINRLIQNKSSVIADCERLISELRDTSFIDNKEIKLKGEQNALYASMKELIEQNSKSKIDQTEYNKQYENLREQYEKITEKLAKIENTRLEWRVKKQKTLDLLNEIKRQDSLITEFDVQLWYALIEKVVVNRNGSMKFEFKNGQEINI